MGRRNSAKSVAGRPTKLSATRIEAICASIALGAPYEQAARAAGIHPATLYRWQELGEAVLTAVGQALEHKQAAPKLTEQERLAARFCDAIQKALADAEIAMIQVVRSAALGKPAEYDGEGNEVRAEQTAQWTAAMTYLERKYPQRWGRRLHVRDDSPRELPALDSAAMAKMDEAFDRAWGEFQPEIDPANLMPTIGAAENGAGANGNGAGP